jgi:polysaccharide biosynthesis/export protein
MDGCDKNYGRIFNEVWAGTRFSRAPPLGVIRGTRTAAPVYDPTPQLDGLSVIRRGQAKGRWTSRCPMPGLGAFFSCFTAAWLLGCTIPAAGPTTPTVLKQVESQSAGHFDFVNVDNRVVEILRSEPGPSLQSKFAQYGKPPPPKIGVGDTVSVTIFEAAAGGLFGAASPEAPTIGAHGTTIPDQVVAPDGAISIPYAGRVPVAGRTPLQVQQDIDQRLSERAIEPEAIVTVTKSTSNTVTVSGEVVTGAQITIPVNGQRLLDVIAAAGGAKAPLYDTFVRLSRDRITATIPMSSLVAHPEENIYVWPGDVVTVVQAPQTFSVVGATSSNSQLQFGAPRINLTQAIAKSGGLQDTRADPAGVFIFRFEARPTVKALGVPPLVAIRSGDTPILYHLDLSKIGNYFLADQFPVKDDDLIYVANASMTDVQKLFTLIGSITGPVIGAAVLVPTVTGK